MSQEDETILIIGAGLAGTTAAHQLARSGRKAIVVEREPEAGGLAKSLKYECEHGTFWYDIGPHRFHTTDDRVHEETIAIMGENKVKRDRVSRIFLYGKFFDYPLQLGKALVQLPKTVMLKAIWDYGIQTIKNLFTKPKDRNFEEWVVRRFGRKLYEVFFGVYTEKTWGIPCTEISADWASQRISQASLLDTIMKSLFRPKGEVRSLVSSFHYPKDGGIGQLAIGYKDSAIKHGAEVHLSTSVDHIHVENGRATGVTVVDEDGNRRDISADIILNTAPLTKLIDLCGDDVPKNVVDHKNSLNHRSMVFVFMILDRPQFTHDHWIYIPEDTLTVHRLSEPKNFSDDCAPADKTLICAEITCDFGDEIWNKSDDELREIAVADLVKIGLIGPKDVLETFTHREFFAYPLYTLDYREHLDPVLGYIDGIENLETTGRQGLFKYNNMDHSIAMGFTAADGLIGREADHRKVATGDEYFG